MIYLDIILKILGIIALITFIIISIWGFVVFNYQYSQIRYTNYLLEKISHILNISRLSITENKKEQLDREMSSDKLITKEDKNT